MRVLMNPANGSCFENSTSSAIMILDDEAMSHPPVKSQGKMVEYQSGSSDMIQSMNASVVVTTESRRAAVHALMRFDRTAWMAPVRSCSFAICRMREPTSHHTRK